MFQKLALAFREAGSGSTKWAGLPAVERAAGASQKLKIKEPPMTANYRNSVGLRNAVTDAQAWMDKHIIEELVPETGIKLRFKYDLQRAYATGQNGEIFFGAVERNAGVVVHESAHVIHWNNKEVANLVNEFFDRRTYGDSMVKYHGENVKKDNFYNPYVGRVYGWEDQRLGKADGDKFFGQEVLSMGFQAMYEDPMGFYKKDKEHFLFIYGIMRGLF